jgi:hypothetical protein
MNLSIIEVKAVPMTQPEWEPYGWIPVSDLDPTDGHHRLEFEWNDVHLNLIAHYEDEISRSGDKFRCDRVFRHLTHTQALMVINCNAVMAVAPPGTNLVDPESILSVKAFALKPLQSFALHRGTWHWGPFPVDAPNVQLFNIQGLRYSEDNESFCFSDHGVALDVCY